MKKSIPIFIACFCAIFNGVMPDTASFSESSLPVRKAKAQIPLTWFTHSPSLINVNEDYSFDFGQDSNGFSFSDSYPNHLDYAAPYGTGSVVATFINETSFRLYAYDSTKVKQQLLPQYSLYTAPTLNSEGRATVVVEKKETLPPQCQISSDTRTLKDITPLLNPKKGENPAIGTGILLYRKSTTNTYGNWNYTTLDYMTGDKNRALTFGPNRNVQLALLYEIENHDNGVWVFQKHYFHHVVGIYTFHTNA